MTEQIDARELFRSAYENRYTWDSDFPGYSANVELKQGDETYTGQIRVAHDFKVEVTNVNDEQVQEALYNQLRDVVTHRKRSAFEQAHGKNSFSLGVVDQTGAAEILVQGDAMGSHYRVRGKEISQVNRVMGRMAFTIDHKTSLDTGEGYISSCYDAVFRNPQTNEMVREMEFEDTYEKVGDYYVMTHQVVRSKEPNQPAIAEEITFSNVKLLEPATV